MSLNYPIYEVYNQQELINVIDIIGPKFIRVKTNKLELNQIITIGGQFGNTAQDTGSDIVLDLNGSILFGGEIRIERGCSNITIQNGSVYAGHNSLPENPTKPQMVDPFTIVGVTALDRPPARDITLRNLAIGFGTDINIHSQADRLRVERCFLFSCLGTPLNPKYQTGLPHSKLALFNNDAGMFNTQYKDLITRVDLIQTVFAFGDDRAPRIAGGVDFTMLDCLSIGCRLGMNTDDRDIRNGYIKGTVRGSEFWTAKQYHKPDGRQLPTMATKIILGERPESRLHFADCVIDGRLHDCESIWDDPKFLSQETFGGTNIPPTPIINRAYDGPPVELPGYIHIDPKHRFDRVLASAGNPFGKDTIQTWAKNKCKEIKNNPENVIYPIWEHENDYLWGQF